MDAAPHRRPHHAGPLASPQLVPTGPQAVPVGSGLQAADQSLQRHQADAPIDTVVGRTKVALHRMNYNDARAAGRDRGQLAHLLTDAFRHAADADISAIRGFRYGTVVPPGSDQARGSLPFHPDRAADRQGHHQGPAAQQSDREFDRRLAQSRCIEMDRRLAVQFQWPAGGHRSLCESQASAPEYHACSIVRPTSWKPLDPEADYTYASYYYARDPDLINTVPATDISVVKDKDGRRSTRVDVVVRYIAGLPNRTTAPRAGRLKLIKPLPVASFGSPEIQPWRGAVPPQRFRPAPAPQRMPAPAQQTLSQGRPQ